MKQSHNTQNKQDAERVEPVGMSKCDNESDKPVYEFSIVCGFGIDRAGTF